MNSNLTLQRAEQVIVRCMPLLAICALLFFVPDVMAADDVTASGGKVATFLNNIISALKYVSLAVVTIAFIFAGYQIAFNHKRIADVAPVLVGAIVIGAAAQLASWFIS